MDETGRKGSNNINYAPLNEPARNKIQYLNTIF
jgi:hypothetical protein